MELTILYDDQCPLCVRVREWLRTQPAHVPVTLVAARSAEGRALIAGADHTLRPGLDLIVVADDGRVWDGTEAYLVVLWALQRYRGLAQHLAAGPMRPMANRAFHWVAANRLRLGTPRGRHGLPEEDCGSCNVTMDARPVPVRSGPPPPLPPPPIG